MAFFLIEWSNWLMSFNKISVWRKVVCAILYQSAKASVIWFILGVHSFCNKSCRTRMVSCIFIFSRIWNCSSLYVSVLEALSLKRCCQESLSFPTWVLAFIPDDEIFVISLVTSDHSLPSCRSVTIRLCNCPIAGASSPTWRCKALNWDSSSVTERKTEIL